MELGRSRPETPEATAIDDASRSLFRLGRAFGRFPRRELLETSSGRGPELSAILVVQAVEAITLAGREVTVGMIADHLGVDPSTASRLVAQSVQAGFLRRVASQVDARARGHALTAAGHSLAEGAAQYQRAVFNAATASWTDHERQEFARLFVRFADAIVPALDEDREMRP
jgi:DNA-binding MarR family transcriptional regulator